MPAAPGRPAPVRQVVARTLQRAQEKSFPIEGVARGYFEHGAGQYQQHDLGGKAQGGENSGILDAIDPASYYSTDAQKVVAYLKVNGERIVIGTNQRTWDGSDYTFTAGIRMRGQIKDNFHAEDWVIKGFKDKFAAGQRKHRGMTPLTLDAWLDTLGSGKGGNAGNPNKHFISIAVSACPCLGCTVSLRAFKTYLEAALTPQGFVLRVKFLKTYSLSIDTYRRQTQSAEDFLSTVGGLREAGIHVRMQPTRSAVKINNNQAFTADIPRYFATNHDAVCAILTDTEGAYLRQSWYEMGVSRKGVERKGEASTPFTTIPTRDPRQINFGGMVTNWALPGSEADNPLPKKKGPRTPGSAPSKRKSTQSTGTVIRTAPVARHAPYPVPGGGQQGRVTTTTTTTTTMPMPVYAPPPNMSYAPPHYGMPYGGPPQYPNLPTTNWYPPVYPNFLGHQQQQQQQPPPQPSWPHYQQHPPQGGYWGSHMPPPGNSGGGTGM